MATKQAIRESVLWSAYGDALGFMTEMRNTKMSGESLLKRRTGGDLRVTRLVPWTRRVGGEFGVSMRLMAGCYSDDTQLRLATCRSIRGDGVFDVETFSKVEIPVWNSYALGAGRGTKTAAESLRKRHVQWNFNFFNSRFARYTDSGGNGAAMRIQPHVWCAPSGKPTPLILKDIIRNTVTTHGHMRAIVGAAFHALCLEHALLKGIVPGQPEWATMVETLRGIPEIIRSDEELVLHWMPMWEKETGKSIEEAAKDTLGELSQDVALAESSLENLRTGNNGGKGQGYFDLLRNVGGLEDRTAGSATKTALLAAYVSYVFRDNPHQGLVEVVNRLGSDTDTIATMAGAILGCTLDADPPEDVLDKAYMEKETERMFELSQNHTTTSYDYPDLLYWQPPLSQLDALGSHEGKWFVQGLGEAEPVGEPVSNKGGDTAVWQWFRLAFGQSVLLKRRPQVTKTPRNSLPVKTAVAKEESRRGTTAVGQDAGREKRVDRQPNLWDVQRPEDVSQPYVTVDAAIERCRLSQFRPDVVGDMLAKLAVQENGIEKSIGFAAIIARYVQTLARRDKPGGH